MMNALLVSSNAPKNNWWGALLTAFHLQNKISYNKTNKTSYELKKEYNPKLNYLKELGAFS